jgi:hypothetical protein
MQRDLEEHISGRGEQETRVEVLAGISRKGALKVEKEKAKQKKIEGATHYGGPIQGNKICKLEEERGRSLANARLLKEFEQMDWIQIDFEEIYNERRPYRNQKKFVRDIELNFPKERHSGVQVGQRISQKNDSKTFQ